MKSGQAKLVTSSEVTNARPTNLIGFYVASTTSGTIVFHDSASTGTNNAVTGTITPAIGWHFLPLSLGAGLRVVIANTLSVTLVYEPQG